MGIAYICDIGVRAYFCSSFIVLDLDRNFHARHIPLTPS
jgi:hypothetical protein